MSDQSYVQGWEDCRTRYGLNDPPKPVKVVTMKGRSQPGQAFLQTREWKAVRKKFLASVPHVCVMCGSTDELQVDHILTRQEHPELALTLSNLRVLCWRCNRERSQRRQ